MKKSTLRAAIFGALMVAAYYLSADTDVTTPPAIPGVGGIGDVIGPTSSIDNEIARFDLTTGKLIQGGSGVIASDLGILTATGLTLSTGELILDFSVLNGIISSDTGDLHLIPAGSEARVDGGFVVGDLTISPGDNNLHVVGTSALIGLVTLSNNLDMSGNSILNLGTNSVTWANNAGSLSVTTEGLIFTNSLGVANILAQSDASVNPPIYDATSGLWYQNLLLTDFSFHNDWDFDATLSTSNNGDLVTVIIDQGDFGTNMVQTTVSKQPTVTNINGKAMGVFDGVDDFIQIGDAFQIDYNFSVIYVATTFDTAQLDQQTVNNDGMGGNRGWAAGLLIADSTAVSNLKASFSTADGGEIITITPLRPGTDIDYSGVHMFVFTNGDGHTKIYVDGRPLMSNELLRNDSRVFNNVNGVAIGALHPFPLRFFDGPIARVMIHTNNTVLSEAQVLGLFKGFFETNYTISARVP